MVQKINDSFQNLFDPDTFHYKNCYTKTIASKLFKCRKTDLGYHCYQCNNGACQHTHLQYHSCGNRHCCFCGTLKKDEWVEDRINDLLPCPYYHVVFTVPHEWNHIMMLAPTQMYKILFDASSQTLLTMADNTKYMGATPGITSVLHTWGQNLDYHVHTHCIVSGGGINNNKWVAPKRSNGKFLFPPAALKKVYKAIFLRIVRERIAEIPASNKQIEEVIEASGYKKWNVYAKKPFGGPEQVMKYLGRYTHKTAITYHRIKAIDQNTVTFDYKDYRDNQNKQMTLAHQEFVSRFERHILPYRFVRIRHYGFLKNYGKATRLQQLREEMDWGESPPKIEIPIAVRLLQKFGRDITKCSQCRTGSYELLLTKRFGKVTFYKPRDMPEK